MSKRILLTSLALSCVLAIAFTAFAEDNANAEETAHLQFRLVHAENEELIERSKSDPENFVVPAGYEKMEVPSLLNDKVSIKFACFVEKKMQMGDAEIINAYTSKSKFGQISIEIKFNAEGAKKFERITSKNIGRQLAIVIDGKCYAAPTIRSPISGGHAEISGSFTKEEAEAICRKLVQEKPGAKKQ